MFGISRAGSGHPDPGRPARMDALARPEPRYLTRTVKRPWETVYPISLDLVFVLNHTHIINSTHNARFLLFPRRSRFGNVMSDQRETHTACCTFSDGKHNAMNKCTIRYMRLSCDCPWPFLTFSLFLRVRFWVIDSAHQGRNGWRP